jgi:hypothetical protein
MQEVSSDGKHQSHKIFLMLLKMLNQLMQQKVWMVQTFRIKLNKREFGHGDIITYDKYNGCELYITDADILPLGDGFIYTVQLVNNDNAKYLDNKYLAAGTKFFRKSSARGEYGERFSDIRVNAGFREFYNFVGGAEAHVHYSVSSRADMMIKGGMNADGSVPVTEIWRNFDKSIDPSITSLEDMAGKMGKGYVKKLWKMVLYLVLSLPKWRLLTFLKLVQTLKLT